MVGTLRQRFNDKCCIEPTVFLILFIFSFLHKGIDLISTANTSYTVSFSTHNSLVSNTRR
jgi:hypothetical protein